MRERFDFQVGDIWKVRKLPYDIAVYLADGSENQYKLTPGMKFMILEASFIEDPMDVYEKWYKVTFLDLLTNVRRTGYLPTDEGKYISLISRLKVAGS